MDPVIPNSLIFFLRKCVELSQDEETMTATKFWELELENNGFPLVSFSAPTASLQPSSSDLWPMCWCAEEWNSLFCGLLFIWRRGTLKLLKKLILPIKSHWLQHECIASTNCEDHAFNGILSQSEVLPLARALVFARLRRPVVFIIFLNGQRHSFPPEVFSWDDSQFWSFFAYPHDNPHLFKGKAFFR